MPADIGGDEHAALRHRLERLERSDDLGQAHAMARVREDVDQIVVALHFRVRDAAAEYNAIGDAARARLLAQGGLLAAAYQQHAQIRVARGEQRQRIDQ
jgi:hypothetical protein